MTQTPPNTVRAFFSTLAGKLDPDAADGLDVVYQFNLNGAEGGQSCAPFYFQAALLGPMIVLLWELKRRSARLGSSR